jgi:hypothetical protein
MSLRNTKDTKDMKEKGKQKLHAENTEEDFNVIEEDFDVNENAEDNEKTIAAKACIHERMQNDPQKNKNTFIEQGLVSAIEERNESEFSFFSRCAIGLLQKDIELDQNVLSEPCTRFLVTLMTARREEKLSRGSFLENVYKFIVENVTIDWRQRSQDIFHQNEPVLNLAISFGYPEIRDKIVAMPDVDFLAQDSNLGESALHATVSAVRNSETLFMAGFYLNFFETLLEKSPDVEPKNLSGEKPVDIFYRVGMNWSSSADRLICHQQLILMTHIAKVKKSLKNLDASNDSLFKKSFAFFGLPISIGFGFNQGEKRDAKEKYIEFLEYILASLKDPGYSSPKPTVTEEQTAILNNGVTRSLLFSLNKALKDSQELALKISETTVQENSDSDYSKRERINNQHKELTDKLSKIKPICTIDELLTKKPVYNLRILK